MRKLLQIGGFVSAAVLIVFGVVAIVMGVNGRSTVQNSLKQEFIVGSPDMTPALIREEAKKAGLPIDAQLSDGERCRRSDRQRHQGTRIRQLHAHPCARSLRWADVLADAALRHRRMARAQTTPQWPCRLMVSRSPTPPATCG